MFTFRTVVIVFFAFTLVSVPLKFCMWIGTSAACLYTLARLIAAPVILHALALIVYNPFRCRLVAWATLHHTMISDDNAELAHLALCARSEAHH